MPRKKPSTSKHPSLRHAASTSILLRAQIGELRAMVAMLQMESLTHLRRITELEHDIDALRKASAAVMSARAPRRWPDGQARE